MMTAPSRPVRAVADLRGRRALVLGLARSGAAASRFLADAGAHVTAYDRRSAEELAEHVAALHGRQIELALGVSETVARALVDRADLLVTSPSVSPRFPTTDGWLRDALSAAEARGAEIVSEVELFMRLTSARIIGVTGTKGKTTTSSLVAAILAQAGMRHVLGGNIGTPLVEHVTTLTSDDWAVLELSELQLPTITRGVDVALYTNVGADHLDRHGSVEAYRAVKARLAQLTAGSGRVVLNRDDPGCRELSMGLAPASVTWYGFQSQPDLDAYVDAGWVVVGGAPVVAVADVRIPGRHLLADVLCAALGAHLAGADGPSIGEAIRRFAGVPHRLETVSERGGVRWVNDSQATIPVAAIAALDAFDAPIVLITGGKNKGLDYGAFGDAIARRAAAVVLLGETSETLAALIGDRTPVHRASTMADAVTRAAALAVPGQVVLLAPAAASFDMFTDYAARGDAFREAVEALEDAS